MPEREWKQRKIWKQILPLEDVIRVKLPRDCVVLAVAVQYGQPVMWYSFHPHAEKDLELHEFRIATTGRSFDIPKDAKYIGMFMLYDGDFVGHLYQVFP